jgi:hypothetical protein
MLFAGMLYNWIANPTLAVLQHSDESEYGLVQPEEAQA